MNQYLRKKEANNADTMTNVTQHIEECVALKTHITDCWNSCKAICKRANNYTHSMVNHSENFIGKFNL